MAELADALDSGSSRGNSVQVQVLLSAPKTRVFLMESTGFLMPYTSHPKLAASQTVTCLTLANLDKVFVFQKNHFYVESVQKTYLFSK